MHNFSLRGMGTIARFPTESNHRHPCTKVYYIQIRFSNEISLLISRYTQLKITQKVNTPKPNFLFESKSSMELMDNHQLIEI